MGGPLTARAAFLEVRLRRIQLRGRFEQLYCRQRQRSRRHHHAFAPNARTSACRRLPRMRADPWHERCGRKLRRRNHPAHVAYIARCGTRGLRVVRLHLVWGRQFAEASTVFCSFRQRRVPPACTDTRPISASRAPSYRTKRHWAERWRSWCSAQTPSASPTPARPPARTS